jgi:hypothetical protein
MLIIMKKYTLTEYISYYGDRHAANLFGVSPRTAASWRRKERVPKPATASRIVIITDGAVSYDGIYGSFPQEDTHPPASPPGLFIDSTGRKPDPTGDSHL